MWDNGSLVCGTRIVHMWHMTHSYHMWDMTRSYVTWLIHMQQGAISHRPAKTKPLLSGLCSQNQPSHTTSRPTQVLQCTYIFPTYILPQYIYMTHVCILPSPGMGWLRLVGSLKLQVSFAEYSLFYRALLQKRPINLRSLLIKATPYMHSNPIVTHHLKAHT